jgi:transcriptional regulator with XRE-family HTH domain
MTKVNSLEVKMWWMNQLDFGNWLIAEAEKRGIYLNDVATAGGMDKSTIFRIAKGTRTAGIDSILAIARGQLVLVLMLTFC